MSEPADLHPAWLKTALDRAGWRMLYGQITREQAETEITAAITAHPEYADLLVTAECERLLDESIAAAAEVPA
jgi:hypothetical protein